MGSSPGSRCCAFWGARQRHPGMTSGNAGSRRRRAHAGWVGAPPRPTPLFSALLRSSTFLSIDNCFCPYPRPSLLSPSKAFLSTDEHRSKAEKRKCLWTGIRRMDEDKELGLGHGCAGAPSRGAAAAPFGGRGRGTPGGLPATPEAAAGGPMQVGSAPRRDPPRPSLLSSAPRLSSALITAFALIHVHPTYPRQKLFLSTDEHR